MASKDLTFNLLARDAGAGAAMLKLAAQMEALNREMKRVSGSGDDVDRSFKKTTASAEKTNRGLSALLTTAVALGPALIPIGTVAAAGLAGIAPAAGVAALAFLGLRRAWKDGTLQATQLGQQITVFRGELTKLESIAAGGVTKGLNQGLKSLQPLFPALERSTALFASQLGGIASHVAPGLTQMFLQLMPLFQTFGDLLVRGSEKFQQWATSGNGIKNFVAYAQTQLPAVLDTLKSLVITVSHVAQGFVPFGSTSLAALRVLSQAINAIPIGVLQALIPVLAGATLGFKAFREAQVASSALQAFSTKLGTSTGIARGASGVMGTLGKAVGFLGIAGAGAGLALGGLSIMMGRNKQAAIENQRRVNDLTQAIMDGAAATVLYTQLSKSGAVKAGTALGIDPKALVDSARGVSDLSVRLQGLRRDQATANQAAADAAQKFGAASVEYQSAQQYAKNFGGEVNTVSAKLKQAQANYADAQKNVAEYAAAQGDAALSADILSGKVQQTAGHLGLATDAYISGKLAADKKTASDAAQTAAMQLEGDAAGLLTAKFNALNDVMLGASDTNLAFKLANLQLQAQLKATNGDLSQNTQAGLQNNQAVNQGIKLAEQDGNALAKSEQGRLGLARATADGTARTLADLQALRASIVAVHGNTDAVDAYIRKLGGVPGQKSTKITADTSAAEARIADLKSHIRDLPARKDIRIMVSEYVTGKTPGGTVYGGKLVQAARGARIPGYGGGDRIPALLEGGETVIPKHLTPMIAPWAKAMGIPGFAGGGIVMRTGYSGPRWMQAFKNNQTLIPLLFTTALQAAAAGAAGPGAAGAQAYARSILGNYGWGPEQMAPLIALWNGESGWRWNALNPSSGAYGIPQALPASKMAAAGADWRTNQATQIRWGLSYIKPVYGSPAGAYSSWLARSPHWYGSGMPPTVFRKPTLIGVGERGAETVSVTPGSGGGGDLATAVARAVAAELTGATFVFDTDGFARMITRRQNAIAGKGPRR